MSWDNSDIGGVVWELREESGYTQARLAERMRLEGHTKWSQSTVWQVENGTRPLRLLEAAELCEILNSSLDELLGGDAPVPPDHTHLIDEALGALEEFQRNTRSAAP